MCFKRRRPSDSGGWIESGLTIFPLLYRETIAEPRIVASHDIQAFERDLNFSRLYSWDLLASAVFGAAFAAIQVLSVMKFMKDN
jgi:hypothetical protein